MSRLIEFIAKFPSTNGLVATAIGLVLLTGFTVLVYPRKAPPEGWYPFLGSYIAAAIAQFTAKRMTHKENGNGNGQAPS